MKKPRTNEQDIGCQEAMKMIAEYVDSQLNDSSVKSLEMHIEKCRHCFDRVEFEKLFMSRLRELHVMGTSDEIRKKIEALFEKFENSP